MGKQNNKALKAKKGGSKSSNQHPPSFDEQALSALTAKLEKDFDKGKPQKQDLPNEEQKDGGSSNSPKFGKGKSKSSVPELKKGTKRDAHGNAKAAGKEISKKQQTAGKSPNGDGQDDRSILLQEILALGGTEEDLDLIAGADSDDEDEEKSNTTSKDDALKKELAKFVAYLGFQGQADEEEAGSNVEEEEEEGEEEEADKWEDASNSDKSEAPELAEVEPAKEAVALAPREIPPSNDPYRLVSTVLK